MATLCGRNRTTASCVALGSSRLVDNGRAPKSGTAARAATWFDRKPVNPTRPPPHARGRGEQGTAREASAMCPNSFWRGPGTARQCDVTGSSRHDNSGLAAETRWRRSDTEHERAHARRLTQLGSRAVVNGRHPRSGRTRVHFSAVPPSGVDMIMQCSVGAPFPTRAGSRSSTSASLRRGPLLASTSRVWGWPGGQNCRPTGLRWQPSPTWGHARQRRARRCRGSCATDCGPAAPARVTTKRGNSRATSATRADDR
jgi:hypothetical protein